VETLPAVAVNVVEVVPAGTMTELDPGGSSVLLLDNNTFVPPTGAAAFNVTAHVVDVPEFKLLGLQTNRETEIVCPKAPLEIKRPVTPVIITLMPVMKSSHNDLPNELRLLVPGGRVKVRRPTGLLPVGDVKSHNAGNSRLQTSISQPEEQPTSDSVGLRNLLNVPMTSRPLYSTVESSGPPT